MSERRNEEKVESQPTSGHFLTIWPRTRWRWPIYYSNFYYIKIYI